MDRTDPTILPSCYAPWRPPLAACPLPGLIALLLLLLPKGALAQLPVTSTPIQAASLPSGSTPSISTVPGVTAQSSTTAGIAQATTSVQLGPVEGLGGGIRPPRLVPPAGQPLSLDDAIRVSLANNLNIFTAGAEEHKAKLHADETSKAFLPHFGLSADYTYVGVVAEASFAGSSFALGTHENYGATGSINEPIDTSGSLSATNAIAKAQHDAQYWALDSARRQVILSTSSAYLGVLRSQSLIEVANQQLTDAQARVSDAQKELAAGTIARYDLLVTQTSLSSAQQQVSAAQHSYNDAVADLNNAMGLSQETALTLTTLAPPAAAVPQFEPSLTAALKNRPELRQIEANVDSAQQSVKLARSGLLPSVSAQFGYTYTGNTAGFGTLANNWTIGVVGSWTPFDWGATRDHAEEAKEDVTTNQYLREQTRQGIEYQVRQSINQIADALQSRTAAEAGVTQAQEQLRLANVRVQAGTGTETEVLDAEAILSQAQTSAANALYNYYAAVANYQRATGTEPLAVAPLPVQGPGPGAAGPAPAPRAPAR